LNYKANDFLMPKENIEGKIWRGKYGGGNMGEASSGRKTDEGI
jgi:hypothetical protein